MDSNDVKFVTNCFVFDAGDTFNEEELEEIAQLIIPKLPGKLPQRPSEGTFDILVKNIDYLPPRLRRYFRLPRPGEKWSVDKETQLYFFLSL